jgi:SMI1 / KNR4 family (SUKH-1)
MKSLDDPAYWLQFLTRRIGQHGPDHDCRSFRNPGRAHELVARWGELASQRPASGTDVLTLDTAIDTETDRQEAPLHSMWWEIRRCFRSWARASGHGDRIAADGRHKSAFHEFLQSSPGPLAQEVLGPGGLGTTVDEFRAALEDKLPPAPDDQLAVFEADLGVRLPEDYRRFVIACNGGYNGMGYQFRGPTPEGRLGCFWLQYLGGFREFERQSLMAARRRYQGEPLRIPPSLVWIANSPHDDAICLGIAGPPRGRVYYFWSNAPEPDPRTLEVQIESVGDLTLLANSFTEFVAALELPLYEAQFVVPVTSENDMIFLRHEEECWALLFTSTDARRSYRKAAGIQDRVNTSIGRGSAQFVREQFGRPGNHVVGALLDPTVPSPQSGTPVSLRELFEWLES